MFWLLSLLRDKEGLRRGFKSSSGQGKTAGLAAGPGDVLEVNGQHKVFGNKRLSRAVQVRCASDWGDAGFPLPHHSFLAVRQPSPEAPHGFPRAFLQLPPTAVCSRGSARDSRTSAPNPSQAKTMHLHFSSDAITPPRAPSPALLPSSPHVYKRFCTPS